MKISKTTKRHLVSASITFISAFLLSLSLSIQTLSMESITLSLIGSILITGVRAGIKGLVENFQK